MTVTIITNAVRLTNGIPSYKDPIFVFSNVTITFTQITENSMCLAIHEKNSHVERFTMTLDKYDKIKNILLNPINDNYYFDLRT